MNERHACRLVGLGRSTCRYRARKVERDAGITDATEGVNGEAHAVRLSPSDGDAGARRDLGRPQAGVPPVSRGRVGDEDPAETRIRWTGAVPSPAASRPNERWSIPLQNLAAIMPSTRLQLVYTPSVGDRICISLRYAPNSIYGRARRAFPLRDRQWSCGCSWQKRDCNLCLWRCCCHSRSQFLCEIAASVGNRPRLSAAMISGQSHHRSLPQTGICHYD